MYSLEFGSKLDSEYKYSILASNCSRREIDNDFDIRFDRALYLIKPELKLACELLGDTMGIDTKPIIESDDDFYSVKDEINKVNRLWFNKAEVELLYLNSEEKDKHVIAAPVLVSYIIFTKDKTLYEKFNMKLMLHRKDGK